MILADIIKSAFSPLIWLFEQILVGVHDVVGGSWGWAIIGLTLLVRLVMFPLQRTQFKSAAVMRAHAPELKKIKERYKDDRVRQNEETMKYFKEVGYNPFSACLPLLLQLPIFISLVYMLRSDLKQRICSGAAGAAHFASSKCQLIGKTVHGSQLTAQHQATTLVSKHASFLFIHDITAKATGAVLIVLIVLYVGTQLVTSTMMTAGQDRNQRIMVLLLPIVFVIFVIQFPAGLLVYWIAVNLTMIPQQYYMLRTYGRPSAPIAVEGRPQRNGRAPRASVGAALQNPKAKPPAGSSGAPAAKPAAKPPPSAARRARRKRSGRRR